MFPKVEVCTGDLVHRAVDQPGVGIVGEAQSAEGGRDEKVRSWTAECTFHWIVGTPLMNMGSSPAIDNTEGFLLFVLSDSDIVDEENDKHDDIVSGYPIPEKNE